MLSGGSMITQDCTLVVGKMCHNYYKTRLKPLVIIKSSGFVVFGHCTYKARQSETFLMLKQFFPGQSKCLCYRWDPMHVKGKCMD